MRTVANRLVRVGVGWLLRCTGLGLVARIRGVRGRAVRHSLLAGGVWCVCIRLGWSGVWGRQVRTGRRWVIQEPTYLEAGE